MTYTAVTRTENSKTRSHLETNEMRNARKIRGRTGSDDNTNLKKEKVDLGRDGIITYKPNKKQH